MGKTKLKPKLFLLEPEKAQLLAELAKELDTQQSTLVRRAIDQLLVRYKKLEAKPRRP